MKVFKVNRGRLPAFPLHPIDQPFSTQLMSVANTTLIAEAEAIVASRFVALGKPTRKMASFRMVKGRHIGLPKERSTAIFFWVEGFNPSISGVEINNRKRPGLPCALDQTRSTGVNTQCSQLKLGSQAFNLRRERTGALERFLDCYETC
jgi:hypothetical protein